MAYRIRTFTNPGELEEFLNKDPELFAWVNFQVTPSKQQNTPFMYTLLYKEVEAKIFK